MDATRLKWILDKVHWVWEQMSQRGHVWEDSPSNNCLALLSVHVLSVCLHTLLPSVCACCSWCETAFVRSIRFKRRNYSVLILWKYIKAKPLRLIAADSLCVIKSAHIPTRLWRAKKVMHVTSYRLSMCPQTIPKSCVLSTDMILLISHLNICLGLFSINSKRNVRNLLYSQCCRELRKTTGFTNPPKNPAIM